MQNLNISLIQFDQVWEDKQANLQIIEKLLAQEKEANLILLPEMFQTGFSMNTELAEPYETSPSIAWLKNQAANMNCAFYTSLMIKSEDKTTNRGVFVYPNGELVFYDKRKTFTLAKEHEHFDAGHDKVIVEYLNWKIQLQICYDLRFPEIMRNSWDSTNESASYDVLLFVANWPAKRSEHWTALLKARAIENQCFVAGVNRIGIDHSGLDYAGDSVVMDALGKTLTEKCNEQKVVSTVLNFSLLQLIREQLPFLRDQNLK